MKSMTGFGNAECISKSGITVRVDIVSYNKKQLDVRALMGKDLLAFEHLTRKIISEKIARGSVTVRVELSVSEDARNHHIQLNTRLAAAYKKQFEKLKKKLKIESEIDINNLINLPGVIEEINVESLLDEATLKTAIKAALEKFIAMREQEGMALKKDITKRLLKLSKLIDKIEPKANVIPKKQCQRLMDNLKNSGLNIKDDDDRVMKEIIIFSDRSDITEEIIRLRSHFQQCNKLLDKKEPVGRAFEFLIQEIQREINTLGTKAAQSSISPLVIDFKTELEKIREQVQNVE